MKLHELKPNKGSTKARKRVGRGQASGSGTFSGRGLKGQQARSGGPKGGIFEGGQTPLLRRMPKLRGFRNINKIDYITINLSDLEERFSDGDTVDISTLKDAKLIKRIKPVKLLGKGKLTKKLTVVCEAASGSAKKAVEAAGGKITLTFSDKKEESKTEGGEEK